MNKRTFLGSLAALCATGLGLAKEKPISGPKIEWTEVNFGPLYYIDTQLAVQGRMSPKFYDKKEDILKEAEEEYTKYFGDLKCAAVYGLFYSFPILIESQNGITKKTLLEKCPSKMFYYAIIPLAKGDSESFEYDPRIPGSKNLRFEG